MCPFIYGNPKNRRDLRKDFLKKTFLIKKELEKKEVKNKDNPAK